MGKLCMELPPFSPDYSGVCSALFPLNCLTVIHDGAGCTGNYTGYDEPRWFHSNSPIYCSGLREIDAILGDDEKLIRKVLDALELLEEKKPEMIALVGSPVPMVIGADMEGIAAEIEHRTGIRSFGFSATGLRYYIHGIEMVDKKIIRRILEESSVIPQRREKSVNILGATPLDFGKTGTIEDMMQLLTERGHEMNTVFWNCRTIDEIEASVHASCNIVVSVAGMWLAKYMETEYGIPYVTGLPYGEAYTEIWLEKLKQCMQGRQEQKEQKFPREQEKTENRGQGKSKVSPKEGAEKSAEESTVLIIGEQIQADSLRDALFSQYGLKADVAGICGWEPELQKDGDHFMDSEAEIEELLNQEKYRIVIGDELYKELLHSEKQWISYNHYAVSSKLGTGHGYSLIGERLTELELFRGR